MRFLTSLLTGLAILAGMAVSAQTADWSISSDKRRLTLALSTVPSKATLRLDGATHGLDLNIQSRSSGEVVLETAWPLLRGQPYWVDVTLPTGMHSIPIMMPVPHPASAPSVQAMTPDVGRLPANTLRLHVQFDRPMARGQVIDHVALVDDTGRAVPDAFLNLGVELWSDGQKRLTLLFDPGRLKRGVGPNLALGSPLKPGHRYAVEIRPGMRDAKSRAMTEVFQTWFETGPAERRQIEPGQWRITRTPEALAVTFDRPMDTRAVAAALRLRKTGTDRLVAPVEIASDRALWLLPPGQDHPFELVVGADLEDVSGNTTCAPFEKPASEPRACRKDLVLPVEGGSVRMSSLVQ